MTLLVLGLRGAVAVAVLVTLVGGLPQVVRLGLVVAVGLWSAAIAGAASVASVAMAPEAALWLIAAHELVVGATIGVVAALPLLAAAMAGQLVDGAGGATRGARSRGPYRALFALLAAAVFVGVDGHVAFVAAIADSFRAVPVAPATSHELAMPRGPATQGLAAQSLAVFARLVPVGARLAAPWLVTAAVVEIAIGVASRVASRAARQLPVAAGTPAALMMMTASLLGTLAVAIAALVR